MSYSQCYDDTHTYTGRCTTKYMYVYSPRNTFSTGDKLHHHYYTMYRIVRTS